MDPEQQGSVLSEYEEQLYDRSIRLWGLEAQKRLRAANILLVGFKGMNAEICKNLVLAGIRSVTIMDDEVVSPSDLGCHLFLTEDSIGKNRAEASIERVKTLNPLVEIKVDTSNVESLPDSFFSQFALVCVSNKSLDALIKLDEVCRSLGVYFMATDSFGLYAYFFSDLHKFLYTKVEEAESETNEKDKSEPSAKRIRTETSTTTTTTTSTSTTTNNTTSDKNTTNGDNNNSSNNNNNNYNNNNNNNYNNNNTNNNNINGTDNTPIQKVTRVEVQFATLKQALESSWKAGVSRRGREGLPRLYVGLHLLYAVRENNKKKENDGEKEDEKENEKIWGEVVQKHNTNTSLLPANFVNSLSANAELHLAPVCAIVGGVAAQEVIKILSANDVPINNFFLYDSIEGSGIVERIPSA